MRIFFKSWSPLQKFWFLAILCGFWFSGLVFCVKQGNEAYGPTDGTSEQIVTYAAFHYAEHGFFEHHLLPTYPPFGQDIHGKDRTEPFVYNHYLAGSDLVLGMWVKLFGEHNVGFARMVPHTLTVVAMAVTTFAYGFLLESALLTCLFLTMLMIPRALVVWSTCLYGHPYASALCILTVGLFLLILKKSMKSSARAQRINRQLLALGAVNGLAITFFAIDWTMLTVGAVMAVFLSIKSTPVKSVEKLKMEYALRLGFGLCIGVFLGVLYQFTISTLEFGSFAAMFQNIKEWMALRSGLYDEAGATYAVQHVNHPLHFVLKEFNRQAYGATGLTELNTLALGGIFILMAYYAKIRSLKQCGLAVIALIVAALSANAWLVVMRHHAMGNLHYVLRHSLIVYVVFLMTALPILRDLILASKFRSSSTH